MDVEETVAMLVRAHPAPLYVDPWQGVLLGQRLRARGLDVREYSFTGASRRKLFGSILDLVRTGRLRSLPHDDLRRELLGLEVSETAAGWRVDHRIGQHDDHVVAVALAAHAVATQPGGGGAERLDHPADRPRLRGAQPVAWPPHAPGSGAAPAAARPRQVVSEQPMVRRMKGV
jgi:hypothetical protein